MMVKNTDISVMDAIIFSNHEELLYKRRDNNMLLSDYQVAVLTRNGIDYKKYGNVRELLFDIEAFLDEEYDDELDMVGSQISEYLYYNETKK